MDDISLSGIGLLSLISFVPLFYLFRRRSLGFFDPINMFLVMRASPMVAFVLLTLISKSFSIYSILFTVSSLIFLCALYFSTPAKKQTRILESTVNTNALIRIIMLILFIKLLILSTSAGSLPIFSKGGSDAYIRFDLENKVGSSILLGLGSAEVVLLAFIIPLIKKKTTRKVLFILLSLAIIIGLANGKKSSLLGVFLSISLGEYLRIYLIEEQKRYFLRIMIIIPGILFVLIWAVKIYTETTNIMNYTLDENTFFSAINLVMSQWAHPFQLFVSGYLDAFFESYNVNKLVYFFHTILSPMGFPAFNYSIGPAINLYLTGEQTGNGINPTFIIEGYVLVGIFLPFYSLFVGFIIGRLRLLLMRIHSIEYKVILLAFLLPSLYTIAIDALLFMKIFFVVLFMFIGVMIPFRSVFSLKRNKHAG